MKTQKLKVKLTLIEPMLGTVPKDKEIYKSYIATKAPVPENGQEEVLTVGQVEEKGWTGFHRDESGIFIYDYMIKGFLKAAGNTLKSQLDMKAMASKVDTLVFVFPRKIHPLKDKKKVAIPHGVVERPLRCQTMQGPRVTLARSDFLEAGCTFEFNITVLDNDKKLSPKMVAELFEYGQFSGLGQFRNGSYGRFTAEVEIQK